MNATNERTNDAARCPPTRGRNSPCVRAQVEVNCGLPIYLQPPADLFVPFPGVRPADQGVGFLSRDREASTELEPGPVPAGSFENGEKVLLKIFSLVPGKAYFYLAIENATIRGNIHQFSDSPKSN